MLFKMKSISSGKAKRVLEIVSRLIAFSSTLAATVVMATSHDSTSVFGLSFKVKYSDTPAFKYFVIANSIVTVYSFVVLFLPSQSKLWQYIIATDMVMAMLLSSNISAALAVAEVGKKGNTLAGWLPICGQIPKFCHQVRGALIVSFIALITYTFLLFHSIFHIIIPKP